ncbi:hypothetical protein K445DRAFT_28143 [Daldinia sp. EC12]|nr:hypothetical protein K445DRAFT_28143 [Daldinia sp. EC12]
MADPNTNNPRPSELNRNAPGPSAPRFQAAGPSGPQNQQSSGARQLASQKRGSEVLDPDPATGHNLTTTEDQVQNRVGRGGLAGAIDLSQRLAQNLVGPRGGSATGYFSGVYVMEDELRPIWIRQEGHAGREIMVSVTALRPGARLQARLGEHVGSPDNARIGLEPLGPARITAPPPPAEEQDKRKKKTRAERRREFREREGLGRTAGQAASQGFSSHDGEDWRTDDFAEREGGDDYTGQNPPSQQEFNFELPAGAPSLPAPTCANCKQPDHILLRCPGPVNEEGVITGCVIHNVMDHTYDDCPQVAFHLDYSHFYFLVESRAGLPPVRSEKWNWVDLAVQFENRRLVAYPLTRAFSLGLTKEAIAAQVFDQDGQTELLRVDPLTCFYEALDTGLGLRVRVKG